MRVGRNLPARLVHPQSICVVVGHRVVAVEAVLFAVLFLPSNPGFSRNSTRHRRSEAIEKPTS